MTYKEYNTPMNVRELIDEFCDEKDAKPSTIELYRKMLYLYVRWQSVNRLDIRKPTPAHLVKYKKFLLDERERSARYVNVSFAALKQFYSWMDGKGYYHNIAREIKSVPVPEGFTRVPLMAADVKKLIASIDSSTLSGVRDKALISLLFTCALRLGEALSLRICDFDPQKESLQVLGKARRQREYVQLTADVSKLITHYLALRADGKKPDDPLFAGHRRGLYSEIYASPLSTNTGVNIITHRLEKAGMKQKNVSAHSLRHGAACELVMAGNTLYEVSVFLRHRNLNISRIYTAYTERKLLNKNQPESILNSLIMTE